MLLSLGKLRADSKMRILLGFSEPAGLDGPEGIAGPGGAKGTAGLDSAKATV